uniref:Glycosyltransferase RgtA/B/C/D-like domain-containing protein n=1 Tax=Solibacter usitatus (strain Ellin6076) TaxID=234267 RepID=Q01PL9_SOLUE
MTPAGSPPPQTARAADTAPAATQQRALLSAILIGLATGSLAYLATRDRLTVTNDEGIYLISGLSVFRGAVPYRDFFAITGPGNFWLLGAIFRMAGVSLRTAHLLVACDLGVLTALAYWLASRLASWRTALGCALLCSALFLSNPTYAPLNHRWDSSTFALASVALAVAAVQFSSRTAACLAGIIGMLAAWITPPVGLIALVVAPWLWLRGKPRLLGPFHAAGAALGALLPAAILNAQGGLGPMLHALFWNAAHYSAANQVAYGFFFGGPAALFAGVHGVEWLPRILLALPFLLPALLPPLVAAAWLPAWRAPKSLEAFLLLCGLALVASNYPRWDLLHLLYISPVFLILGAVWLDRHTSGLCGMLLFLAFFLPAGMMCLQNLSGGSETTVATPVGRVQVSESNAQAVRMSVARIRPGDSLFVFPYEPVFYFLTGARNPTRYFWLQPGMMSDQDERTAYAELNANPPDWILYRDIPPAEYLRIWPGTDPARLRLSLIEDFIRTRYVACDLARGGDGERQLLKRR